MIQKSSTLRCVTTYPASAKRQILSSIPVFSHRCTSVLHSRVPTLRVQCYYYVQFNLNIARPFTKPGRPPWFDYHRSISPGISNRSRYHTILSVVLFRAQGQYGLFYSRYICDRGWIVSCILNIYAYLTWLTIAAATEVHKLGCSLYPLGTCTSQTLGNAYVPPLVFSVSAFPLTPRLYIRSWARAGPIILSLFSYGQQRFLLSVVSSHFVIDSGCCCSRAGFDDSTLLSRTSRTTFPSIAILI